MLPAAMGFTLLGGGPGPLNGSVRSLYEWSYRLPMLFRWVPAPDLGSATGACLLTVALLSVLLLVAGGWPSRGAAPLGLAWFLYFVATFSQGGLWRGWMIVHGSPLPAGIVTLVGLVVVTLVAVFAFVTAAQLRRQASVEQRLPADNTPPET
jgi:hypothetical protein